MRGIWRSGTLSFVAFWLIGVSPAAPGEIPSRVSELEGSAAFESADQKDWAEATINLPVLGGHRFFVHEESRMEIELAEGGFLRLGAETDLSVRRLGRSGAELELTLGDLIVRSESSSAIRVKTPVGRIMANRQTVVRVAVDSSGLTSVTVRKGSVTASNDTMTRTVSAGQAIEISAPARAFVARRAGELDELDWWSDRRDARDVGIRSASYLEGDAPGMQELDRYGQWSYVSNYGVVWTPRVATNWWPYRDGEWTHLPGWGWTWISYEPWGWLPYHYGQWAYIDHLRRWCWVPGSLSTWSPAGVQFYHGNGFVGWSPRLSGSRFGTGHPGPGLTVVPEDSFSSRIGQHQARPRGVRRDDLRAAITAPVLNQPESPSRDAETPDRLQDRRPAFSTIGGPSVISIGSPQRRRSSRSAGPGGITVPQRPGESLRRSPAVQPENQQQGPPSAIGGPSSAPTRRPQVRPRAHSPSSAFRRIEPGAAFGAARKGSRRTR